jgi:hypothetical protein
VGVQRFFRQAPGLAMAGRVMNDTTFFYNFRGMTLPTEKAYCGFEILS